MYKGLLVIVDGLGDRPNANLDGCTPLAAAQTPAMDSLLAAGSCGLVDPLKAGYPVDTHTGSAALMGAARTDILSLSRGWVEAAGIGIKMLPGDILLRANFATLQDDGLTIIDRRAGRIESGTETLCQALQDVDLGQGIYASVFPSTHHRAVIRLRGDDLSAEISNTDPCSMYPHAQLLASQALNADNAAAQRTAQALNALMREAHNRLRDHPSNKALKLPPNALLARSAGEATALRGLVSHLGLSAAVISGERTLHGLGKLLGIKVVYQAGFTATAETDLAAKFSAAQAAMQDHDLVFLHIKATDIFSHNKDPGGKRDYLEIIDACMAKQHIGKEVVIGITGDHSTDSNTGNHCGDPVPSLLSGPNCRIDNLASFSEVNCNQGGLGRLEGGEFLLCLLDHMGCLPNYQPHDAMFVN